MIQDRLIKEAGADNTVGADHAAVTALDADLRRPHRHKVGNITFLPLGGAAGVGTIDGDHADGEIITPPSQHRCGHLLHK